MNTTRPLSEISPDFFTGQGISQKAVQRSNLRLNRVQITDQGWDGIEGEY